MKILLFLLIVSVPGCATAPAWLAAVYDRNDPCQVAPLPSWCGAGSHSVSAITRDVHTGRVLFTTKVPK